MKAKIFYRKEPTFRQTEKFNWDDYAYVTNMSITSCPKGLNEAFHHMQAEVWSPNGEARPLIQSLGLHHTSMSVGDLCVVKDQVWEVHPVGWKRMKMRYVAPE